MWMKSAYFTFPRSRSAKHLPPYSQIFPGNRNMLPIPTRNPKHDNEKSAWSKATAACDGWEDGLQVSHLRLPQMSHFVVAVNIVVFLAMNGELIPPPWLSIRHRWSFREDRLNWGGLKKCAEAKGGPNNTLAEILWVTPRAPARSKTFSVSSERQHRLEKENMAEKCERRCQDALVRRTGSISPWELLSFQKFTLIMAWS